MQRWYCVQLKPGKTTLALDGIKRRGYEVFYPTFRSRHVDSKTKLFTAKVYPLFPNYAFTKFDVNEDYWQEINYSVHGVKRVMGGHMTEFPTPVPENIINEMIRKCADGPLNDFTDLLLFRPGQVLRVIEGPLAGEWVTCEWSDQKRVYVLLSLFGRRTRAMLNPSHVEAVAVNA